MVTRIPTRVLATPNAMRATAAVAHGDVGVALHHIGRPELAGLGGTLNQAAAALPRTPSVLAWDFLSIALAVHAADRFVIRKEAADSWTRMIALEVELADPEPWAAQAGAIEDTLRFLSSDIWSVRFRGGGARPPAVADRPTDRDCACLFSGGLDSLIGALDLRAEGRRPLLVSQASPKEGSVQRTLAGLIGMEAERFSARASERWRQPYEPSSRARSMLFLGYGAVAASSLARDGVPVDLFVPENGLISINAPLTHRRMASLSTRTTHPHFISSLQRVLDGVGLPARIRTPYALKTKGQMLAECRDELVHELAHRSYSCGKGKRLNQHCGRCVPCLIRRASFEAAGMRDGTDYWANDLSEHASNEDVAAARFAAATLERRDVARWASEAGPLPTDPDLRRGHVDVVRRGTAEVKTFLDAIAWP